MIEKSARGVYILPEVWDDEIFNLQNRLKRGIYSHETALFLWDFTDRTPNRYYMTFSETVIQDPLVRMKNSTIIQSKECILDFVVSMSGIERERAEAKTGKNREV